MDSLTGSETSPKLSEYLEISKPLPITRRLSGLALSPVDVFERATRPPHRFLLESAQVEASSNHYSIIGSEPFLTLKTKGTRIEIVDGEKQHCFQGNPLEVLRELWKKQAIPKPAGLPPFFGGAVGFLGYDLVQFLENLPSPHEDDLQSPDLYLLFVDTIIIFDHHEKMVSLVYCPPADRFLKIGGNEVYEEALKKFATIEDRLARPSPVPVILSGSRNLSKPRANMSKKRFLEMIKSCKDYIASGDIYQANLSQRFTFDSKLDPWTLYLALRKINPSPFSAYLEMEELCLVSASPERLIRLQDGVLETRPIAGTRPRGRTAGEDRRLYQDLLNNDKERSEHIMLVDLERNDIGRVSQTGTVFVDELMTIEKYSHVIHMVSNIRGELLPDKDLIDVIRAIFPGGTITGVPKIRCMEIIAELEPVCRGPYTGSIGYISFSGEMDLNIAIRTFIISKNRIHVQVGAGIVADSNPEEEYQETLHKAEALFKAIRTISGS